MQSYHERNQKFIEKYKKQQEIKAKKAKIMSKFVSCGSSNNNDIKEKSSLI